MAIYPTAEAIHERATACLLPLKREAIMPVQRAVRLRDHVGNYPNHLFEPHVLLPTQQTRGQEIPERRLVSAILADAINCFQRQGLASGRKNRRAAYESERWIMSCDRDWPFSFENICEVLDIDAQWLRSSLLRWRLEQRMSPPRAGGIQTIATVHRLRAQCRSIGFVEEP